MENAPAPSVCIVNCSPRHGNTDTLCAHVARGLAQFRTETLFLRDSIIQPCIACGHCSHPPHFCPLDGQRIDDKTDETNLILEKMHNADMLALLSPVFFYGIPAHAKALIDRSQRLWMAARSGVAAPQKKPALICLVAARAQGDNLFRGSLWTLHYFLDALGFQPVETALFPGFDAPDSLAQDAQALERVYVCSQNMIHASIPPAPHA